MLEPAFVNMVIWPPTAICILFCNRQRCMYVWEMRKLTCTLLSHKNTHSLLFHTICTRMCTFCLDNAFPELTASTDCTELSHSPQSDFWWLQTLDSSTFHQFNMTLYWCDWGCMFMSVCVCVCYGEYSLVHIIRFVRALTPIDRILLAVASVYVGVHVSSTL